MEGAEKVGVWSPSLRKAVGLPAQGATRSTKNRGHAGACTLALSTALFELAHALENPPSLLKARALEQLMTLAICGMAKPSAVMCPGMDPFFTSYAMARLRGVATAPEISS